jgi:hypothetical protein
MNTKEKLSVMALLRVGEISKRRENIIRTMIFNGQRQGRDMDWLEKALERALVRGSRK